MDLVRGAAALTGLGAVAPAALLACGALVAWRWLGNGCAGRARRIVWALALAPALGFGPPAILVAGCALFSLRLPGVWFSAALFALLFALVAWWAGRREPPRPDLDWIPAPERRESRWLVAAALATLVLVAARATPTVAEGFRKHPKGTWDAVAIWNARASLLFRDASQTGAVLRVADPDGQPHYPLAVPGSVAAAWALLGYESDAAAAAVSAAWYLGILALTGLALSGARRHSVALGAFALLLSTPALLKWVPSQCADLAVGYFLLLGALAAAASLRDPAWRDVRLPPGLLGWSLGLLANSKTEGLVAAAGLGLGWLGATVAARRQSRAAHWRTEAVAILPWIALRLGQRLMLGPESEKLRFVGGSWILRLTDSERWSSFLTELAARLDPLATGLGWSGFWPVVMLASLATLLLPRSRLARFPGICAATLLSTLGAVALVISTYDIRYVVDTALDRLLAQIAPLALVLALAPWSGSERSVTRGRSPLLAATGRLASLLRSRSGSCLALGLAGLLAGKLALLRPSVGAMWRWPEELVVATTAYDLFAPVLRGAVEQLSAPNLVSALLAPIDLLRLEGATRYRALLTALNLVLAAVLSLALHGSERRRRAALGWGLFGGIALSGWVLLGDALAGAAFLLFLVTLERALHASESARAWTTVAAAAALAALSDPSLGWPLLVALAAALALRGVPVAPSARRTVAACVLAPLLVAGLASAPDSFWQGAGAYLDRGLGAPLLLLDARGTDALPAWGAAFLRELGYFHFGTLGWTFAGLVALALAGRSRRPLDALGTLAVVLLTALGARGLLASAGMALAEASPPVPRNFVYGRAIDFALPAGLWLGARILQQVRLRRSGLAAALASLTAGGGAALFLVSLPDGYSEASRLHQLVPFQNALAPFLRLQAMSGAVAWALPAALALVAGLATAPLSPRGRKSARLVATIGAAGLIGGTGLAILGEIATESTGSLMYHSSAARVAREAHLQGRFEAVVVDAPILDGRPVLPADILPWKDSLRVLADLPSLSLSASPPPGSCPALLTRSRLPDRELVAAFYGDALFLWGPRPGPGCEFERSVP